MDAAADHPAALVHGAQRGGHQRADRREKDGRIERLRRKIFRAAGPSRAERQRIVLRSGIARAQQMQVPALVAERLRDRLRLDLCRRAGL